MKLGIKFQILILVLAAIIIGSGVLGTYAVMSSKTEIINSAHEKLTSDLSLGKELLNQRYPGPWHIENNQLYKGSTLMNNNFSFVDQVGNLTHDTVTIFLGDMRIATNVKTPDGKRAVGTKVSPQVASAVLKNGKTYIGEAVVVGTTNQTAYEPIRDESGKIIGIWYVGVPNSPYEAIASHLRTGIILFGLIELIIFSLIAWFVVGWRVKPLTRLSLAAEKVAEGDLTIEVLPTTAKDEIGILTNSVAKMVTNLRQLLKSINEQIYLSTQQIATGTDETSNAIENISHTFTEVASSSHQVALDSQNGKQAILETSAVLLELSSLIQMANSRAGLASESSITTSNSATNGRKTVSETIHRMETINNKAMETGQLLEELISYSEQIHVMTQTITEIANQTNLLALNAAIEAARAGEAGKGFSVVANEVKKLANQSNKGAEEVSSVIQKILSSINVVTESMTESRNEVELGVQAAVNSGKALDDILNAVNQTVSEINEIRSITSEEVSTSDRIIELINTVSSIIETSATSSEEVSAMIQNITAEVQTVAASSEEIHAMADELNASLKKFTI